MVEKIGIDAFCLERNDSGIEVYTKHLIDGLIQSKLDVELYSYSSLKKRNYSTLLRSSNWPASTNSLKKLLWQQWSVHDLISENTDIFHSPAFSLPMRKKPGCKYVVTVHDLAFYKHPEFFDWKTKGYYKLILNSSLQNADRIICISESCKQDVEYYFPQHKDKIKLVYNGFKNYSLLQEDVSILKTLNINKPFLLFLGTLNPRKNLQNCISAFKLIAEKHDIEMVIVGTSSKLTANLMEDKRIKVTGFISDQELAALYKNAGLLVFPSFYEGFGFPILEAMSCGLPVLTANNSSLPEITNYKPEYFCNPYDVKNMAELIEFFLFQAPREQLVQHGYNNIKRFAWGKMVEETIAVYETI